VVGTFIRRCPCPPTCRFPQASAPHGTGRQGFSGRQAPVLIKATHLNRLIDRLGVLQIDSVNAVVRSHYLPLFSRLGQYAPSLLEQAAWSQGRQRSLFEYWGHEASLLPMALYPLMRWRMERARQGQGIYAQMARFGREQQAIIQRVLNTVEQQGALGAGSLSTRAERAGRGGTGAMKSTRWNGCSPLAWSRLPVGAGSSRLYDLPERVIPGDRLHQAPLSEAEAQRGLLLHSATALGVGSEKDLRDYSAWSLPTLAAVWPSWSKTANC